jgi:hypothetical protein
MANSKRTTGRAIVDIGSGKLQCLPLFNFEITNYLFSDPDLDIKKLPKSVPCEELPSTDPATVVNYIKALNSNKKKVVWYKGKAEDILMSRVVLKYLASASIPMTFSFSCSHVYELLMEAVSYCCTVIGCCYVYDKVSSESSPVTGRGFFMGLETVSGQRVGVFKLGTSTMYKETPITHEEMEQMMTVETVTCEAEDMTLYRDLTYIVENMRFFYSG